jgi:uncharacterized membrane protein
MRFFGHPVHPMLVHFPIVFWTVAAAAYVAAAVGAGETVVLTAKYANGGGLAMALPAMVAGLLELRAIDSRSEAMQVATRHMMIMATAWTCFLFALLLPLLPDLGRSSALAAAAGCAGVGFLLVGIGGWLGGRLVYELGIAVKERTKS